MARRRSENAWPGYDSFLDIVANIVGILIILVLVVGVRVRRAPVDPSRADPQLARMAEQIEARQAAVLRLRSEVLQLGGQLQQLEREKVLRGMERDRLATVVAAWERKLETEKAQLSEQQQTLYRLQEQIDGADRRRKELEQLLATDTSSQRPNVLVNYPTPLARTVEGPEAHFQLRAGRIAYIPLEKLLDQVRREGQRRVYELLGRPELTDTVGPEGGFRLRYTLRRYDVSVRSDSGARRTASYARLEQWTLIPTKLNLGEPVAEALRSGSQFRSVLSRLDPSRSTVTVWIYPDSFDVYQTLKQFLHEQGFACAARPLPHGIPVGGSPRGSRSAAE